MRVVGGEVKLPSPERNVQLLNAAMEEKQPAVVHYDPGGLDAQDPSFAQSLIGFHVSVIVARADIQGKRYYLLRNSWGSNCGIYADEIESRCDRGHIWLSEKEIRNYVTSVAYLSTQ
jgi:hypothetical protein